MSLEYPQLAVLSPVEGGDQDDVSEALTARLIADHPDLDRPLQRRRRRAGVAKAIADAGRETSRVRRP